LPEEVPGKHEVDRPRIERAVREILFTIGEGSERTGLLGTPERVADACAFSFCWWAYVQQQDTQREEIVDRAPERQPVLERPETVGEKEEQCAQRSDRWMLSSWPVDLREVKRWLDPWVMLWRFWRAWSNAPPPPALQALLDAVGSGQPLRFSLYV
jgi:hypothetical protein